MSIRPAAFAAFVLLMGLVACGPDDGPTPPSTTRASASTSGTAVPGAATRIVRLAPVDADGDVAEGYTVVTDGRDEVNDCSATWSAGDATIYTCGITAAGHVACWPESKSQALCLSSAWDRSLTRILVGSFDTDESSDPILGVELSVASGTDRCHWRVSGAADHNETDDDLVVSHVCSGAAMVWAGGDQAGIDQSGKAWTASYGEPDEAPRPTRVAAAWIPAVADDVRPEGATGASGAVAGVRVRGPVDDLTGVQKYADILAAGDFDRIRRGCWTIAPETLETQFVQRATILDAFRKPGEGAQSALIWRNDDVMITFPWAEVESPLACPGVGPAATGTPFTAADAAWVIHRLAMRYAGAPVAPSDTEENYPLACEPPVWNDPPYATMLDATKRSRLEALDGQALTLTTVDGRQRAELADGSAYAEFSTELGVCIGDLG